MPQDTGRVRHLTDSEIKSLEPFRAEIHYSTRYKDDLHEYRHVILPKLMLKSIPREFFDTESGTLKLLLEDEWRALGITQVSNISSSHTSTLTPYRASDGHTTRHTSPNPGSCSSSASSRLDVPLAATRRDKLRDNLSRPLVYSNLHCDYHIGIVVSLL